VLSNPVAQVQISREITKMIAKGLALSLNGWMMFIACLNMAGLGIDFDFADTTDTFTKEIQQIKTLIC